jgi:regulator of protease activity HflC (stomatin/prohibitin superfamily)
MAELKYPVATADVLLTNIDYPPEVTQKRKNIKAAELQDLENAAKAKAEVAKAKRDAEIALEKGKAQLVAAKADAAANSARAKSLTPEILAVKQLETLVELAKGPNNAVVVIPFDAIRPGGMQDMLLNREAIDRMNRRK